MPKYFYEVAPADKSYHGASLLTYGSNKPINSGQTVKFTLRNKDVLGFVVKEVKEPNFKVKLLIPQENQIPDQSVELFNWLRSYYPAPAGVTAQHFVPRVSYLSAKIQAARKEDNTSIPVKSHKTTSLQQQVIDNVPINTSGTFIVHGETGSGKTKVYVELAKKLLKQQLSALILVPEISLSPQIYNGFKDSFGNKVLLTHSDLTPKQRGIVWRKVAESTEPFVVVGPRSALFLPYSKLGLIVVDEFHESAYKQESAPYYNSLRLASKLSQIHNCPLVLGSATPSVSEYYWAEQKNVPILTLPKLASPQSPGSQVAVESVNLSDSTENSGHPLLSKTLLKNISLALKNKEQILLFLNKRGSSRAILCQDCGWRSKCNNCNLPLTYHQDSYKLACHTCGFTTKPPTSCPSCSSSNIVFKSPGTKSIISSLEKLFPEAKLARFDKDNLKAERIGTRHQEVISGEIDILVGTQILSKGHDLPKLGLVGILQAEASLQFPDFTANERSYQIIHQLIGRVGRGHRSGTVVLQSYMPDNPTIQDAIKHNWQEFYAKELEQRRLFGFPPFFHLLKIEAARATPAKARQALEDQVSKLQNNKSLVIVGPSPSFIEKKQGKSNWQLVIKAKNRSHLVEIVNGMPPNFTANLDPSHLL